MKNLLFLALACFILFPSFSKSNIPETPFSEYIFPAKECKVIHHHQSRILVPAHTFYLDGKFYEGEVHLKYREFVDQLDIVLNHIPMNYNENDKHHVLESGGMFELYAYGNGRQLSFAPNKKISVQLATKFDMTGGETFVFNKASNSWVKQTSFAGLPESNQVLTDNKDALWGDHVWRGDEWQTDDNQQALDSVYSIDPSTGMTVLTVVTSSATRAQAFKTINVDKMEFYNCDRILKEDAVPMVANFKLEGYTQQLNSEIYVVYKKINAVITYYPDQFASSFKLLPDEDLTIFSYSKDGKIAVLDPKFMTDFNARANTNKTVVFPMKVFAKLPGTKEELAALTGL